MLDDILPPVRRWSIALIVSAALASVVTVVLLVFAVLFYKAEQERRWDELHQTLVASADQLAVAVALPAWNFDDGQILALMHSGLANRSLYAGVVASNASKRNYVLVRNEQGQLANSPGVPQQADWLVERRPIMMAGQVLGSVSVYATPVFVVRELRQRRLAIVGGILVLDAALVLSVYLLLWYLMLKPLKAVGHYAATVKAGHSVGAVPHKAWFFGELKTLNESIRDMVNLLDSRYRAMRLSEERMTIASRAANVGIWDWHIRSNELVWDEQMYRQYGVPREHFGGVYEAWAATVLPEDLPGVRASIDAALRGEEEYAAEFRIRWPDGTVRHIKAESLTTHDEHGQPVRMVGVNYDISASKLAEQELLRHRNHLEELVEERTRALSVAVTEATAANRAKSVFLATMSHELRTPLNSVIGFSHMMADSPGMSGEEKRNLAIIHRSGQHLLTLINDILELSKIEAGRTTLQDEVVDLQELVQEVMDMVSARARQLGLRMTLDCAGMPAAVHGDGAKLRQVLLNLMSNAVKFALQGSVTLEVRTTPLALGRHALAFAVRDSGIGIAKADQARIFEPFVQAGSHGSRDGTGLGLAISREFVHMMGGVLSVESEPGVGSVFAFTLALEQAAHVPLAAPARIGALAPGERGKRILVVDDNGDGRALLAGLLTPLGFLVGEAADGGAALAAIERDRPDLVFMDWRMPGLDGLAVTRRLRADPGLHQPRVVMLTASAFEEERQEALAAGADDFLRKPIEHDKLFRVLEVQLDLHFLRAEPVRAPLPAADLTATAVQSLPAAVRSALRTALQELNLTRVEQILQPIQASHTDLVKSIERMLEQHRYPQLCRLIDGADQAELT